MAASKKLLFKFIGPSRRGMQKQTIFFPFDYFFVKFREKCKDVRFIHVNIREYDVGNHALTVYG